MPSYIRHLAKLNKLAVGALFRFPYVTGMGCATKLSTWQLEALSGLCVVTSQDPKFGITQVAPLSYVRKNNVSTDRERRVYGPAYFIDTMEVEPARDGTTSARVRSQMATKAIGGTNHAEE